MNDSFLFDCVVTLCSSDHISGFISPNPVIDSRDKITAQRLSFLYKLVKQVKDNIEQQNNLGSQAKNKYCFERAIQLTSSDISSGVIAVEPILYDRDEKISEVIAFYFNMIAKSLIGLSIELSTEKECEVIIEKSPEIKDTLIEYKTVVIPVYKKMKKSKIKKGKR
ncbi:hypothetical protein [Citrobacter sp. Marseille-Q6884]|uniref:hypothetical protein n=1 Tax=Citrobacter sp. Marseille-Q6884 TaxID=2956786 RepID=UPI0021B2ECB3|nr:hypothetical protein [Citrobacter sp. Marseille-Q6884]